MLNRKWHVIGVGIIGFVLISAASIFILTNRSSQSDDEQTDEKTEHISQYTSDDLADFAYTKSIAELDEFYGTAGSTVTITTRQTVSEWDGLSAVRVQTSGGESFTKAWQPIRMHVNLANNYTYAYYVPVKNNGRSSVKVIDNKGASQVVAPGEETTLYFFGWGESTSPLEFQLHTVTSVTDDVDVLIGSMHFLYKNETN